MADTLAEAAAMLGRLLAAVERGDLDANGALAKQLLRRLEGAQRAWEVASAQVGKNVQQ